MRTRLDFGVGYRIGGVLLFLPVVYEFDES